MSVAVFIYNHSTSGVAYSGGRYHALLIAYALAIENIKVSIISDTALSSVADMLDHESVEYTYTPHFDPNQVTKKKFDFVLVAPTGAFYPEFYNCAEIVAEQSRCPVGLINYESANWFNALVPTPDLIEVWDYWQRVVVNGGLVISSTKEGDRHARGFYRSDGGELRFDHCYPPINSAVADRVGFLEKDGSIILFARPYHDHKGSADVLSLAPSIFAGRTLHVVFGGQPSSQYCEQIESRITPHGATLVVHSKISDEEKFILLARAAVLLFPSRFEGYGYPPVEAAYAGTEIACYNLPVLVETVGKITHMAPVANTEALGEALRAALKQPSRPKTLRDAVRNFVQIDRAAARMRDILIMARTDLTGRHQQRDNKYSILWGPWNATEVDMRWTHMIEDLAPSPPYGAVTADSQGGSVRVKIVIWTRGTLATSIIKVGSAVFKADSIKQIRTSGSWAQAEVSMQLHGDRTIGKFATLNGYNQSGKAAHPSYVLSIRTVGHV
jgi:glycosyltransferase involved in cell wall biosynthesis